MTRVTIADLATAAGVGKRTAIRLVREGRLPGFMDGERYICPPGEYEDWLAGQWEYRGIPSDPARKRDTASQEKPIEFVQKIRKGKAA